MTDQRSSMHGKLVLPTVDTCRHRQSTEVSDVAHCRLLRDISGVVDPRYCRVSRAACKACCESFPPTVKLWNSVVASLVYGLAERVLQKGGVAGCPSHEAQRLHSAADEILEITPSSNRQVIPLRVSQACCFLGERVQAEVEVANLNELSIVPVATFNCSHPDHRTTTLENCRDCRDWSARPPISRPPSLRELVPLVKPRSGTKVRHWAVGVVTAPRRQATLEWCLDSLTRAGWDRPYLFVDGLLRIPDRYEHLPLTWREQPLGAWPNYFLALSEMVLREPAADAYLLLQDDAVLYDRGDLREYLEATLWPGERESIVSLYCPKPYTILEPGWRTLPHPWVWGALAFVFPHELAQQFISNQDVIAHRGIGPYEGRAQVDVLIGEWAATHGHAVVYPCPSLAQHVGNTSSIWRTADNDGFRRADWFAGDLESPFAVGPAWSDFQEDRFPCRAELRHEYQRTIDTGHTRMAQRRVVICGLCRNVRQLLPQLAARIERLGAMFGDYQVVLYENDSIDATHEFLRDWQHLNHRVHFLSERLGTTHYPSIRSAERVTYLAEYRNRYRRYVLDQFADFDHVIVVDTDLAGGWSNDGIANTFGHDDWDFVGSWGLLQIHSERSSEWQHYDAWAFRAVGHPHEHSNIEVNSMVLERGEPLLPVLSCFGGLGVYRMAAFKSAAYGGPDCEHVILHQRMRQCGFVASFLNPSQIVAYSPG